jgi:hypothetical protein
MTRASKWKEVREEELAVARWYLEEQKLLRQEYFERRRRLYDRCLPVGTRLTPKQRHVAGFAKGEVVVVVDVWALVLGDNKSVWYVKVKKSDRLGRANGKGFSILVSSALDENLWTVLPNYAT